MSIANIFNTLKTGVTDNSPAILTAMGAIGVVSTAVMSARAAVRAHEIIYEHEPDMFETDVEGKAPLTSREKFNLTWHLYVPAVATGAVSIVCILGSHSINAKRNAAIMGLYSMTDRTLNEYREKVIEVVGEGKERDIHDRHASQQVANNPRSTQQTIRTGHGDHLCFDMSTERYFTTNIERIKQTVEAINEELRTRDTHITVNEFYRRIGLPPIVLGDDVGWTSEKLLHISYTSTLDDHDWPCLVLNYREAPLRGPRKT